MDARLDIICDSFELEGHMSSSSIIRRSALLSSEGEILEEAEGSTEAADEKELKVVTSDVRLSSWGG